MCVGISEVHGTIAKELTPPNKHEVRLPVRVPNTGKALLCTDVFRYNLYELSKYMQ